MSEQSQRNHSIDLLRFIAAFGIVWAHMVMATSYTAALGYTALSTFLIMVPFLSVARQEHRAKAGLNGRNGQIHVRIQRILTPWLFWCLVYKLLLAYTQRDVWAAFRVDDPYSLLAGPSIHLWFLPFILVASAMLFPLARKIKTPATLIAATVASTILSTASLYLHDADALPAPFAQWAFAMPPFLFSLLAAYGRKFGLAFVPTTAFLGVCMLFLVFGHSYWPAFSMLAVPLFALAYLYDHKNETFHFLGTLSFGIYLTHPIFMLVWFKFVPPDTHLFIGALVVFAMSTIATVVLSRIAVLRTVV